MPSYRTLERNLRFRNTSGSGSPAVGLESVFGPGMKGGRLKVMGWGRGKVGMEEEKDGKVVVMPRLGNAKYL